MATEAPAPLPGDIIQITDADLWCHAHFALVEEVRRWGVSAVFRFPSGRNQAAETFIRLKPDQFVVCGAAALLPPQVAAARQACVQTAQEVAADEAEPDDGVVLRAGGWFATGTEMSGPWATEAAARAAKENDFDEAHRLHREAQS